MQASKLSKAAFALSAISIAGTGVWLWQSSSPSNAYSADHDGLIRITPERITMAPQLSTLCIKPRPTGPHAEPDEILIYANQIALDYRRDHPQEFAYPIGSKFVKEKYSRTGDENPDAATIMERTRFSGDVTDWAFSIVSLPDKTPLKASGEVSCASCHEGYKDTGFVSYDSEEALKKYLGIE